MPCEMNRNMICYRRYGHNEGDEPAFTQPLMYAEIKKHATLFNIYADQLATNGVIARVDSDKLFDDETDRLQVILDKVREKTPVIKNTI